MNAMRYKVTITFAGTASLFLEADTVEEARLLASELTVPDLARTGVADVLTLKVGAREIVPARADEEDAAPENAPRTARPSGWYRPL